MQKYRIVITRDRLNINGCFGVLELFDYDGELLFECYTLERLKEGLESNKNLRIPPDKYNTLWHKSPRFKRFLLNLYSEKVPVTRRILIHVGNYLKNTNGCILVGLGRSDEMVTNSIKCLNELHRYIMHKEVEVVIENKFE